MKKPVLGKGDQAQALFISRAVWHALGRKRERVDDAVDVATLHGAPDEWDLIIVTSAMSAYTHSETVLLTKCGCCLRGDANC